MLMLVLGDNLLVMFVGWEGVGLCSYLLIGFWYLEDHNAMCGQKAFVVNRIGDFGFLLGIFLLFWAFFEAGEPTIEFRAMAASIELIEQTVTLPSALSFLPAFPTWGLLTLAGLCLFVGAMRKVGADPALRLASRRDGRSDARLGADPRGHDGHRGRLHGLPDVLRCTPLAPGALATVAWVGALTALFAATIGICQKDIKKVLAYSTVSQLGYMFMAAGVGAYSAAIFHLMTHAFFKALLFLGAGSVILGMHHEQNTDKMGGLWRRMPVTHGTFLIAVLAISGAPIFSGFFSKDEILLGAYLAHDVPGHYWIWGIGVLTAGLTAFYMFRLYFLTFLGENRSPSPVQSHIKESPSWILVPLVVLAVLSLFGGFVGLPDVYGEMLGIPDSNSLHYFLQASAPSEPHVVKHSTELNLAGLAVLAGLAGAALAWFLYHRRPELPDRIAHSIRGLYGLVWNKYYVDEIYDFLIVRPLIRFSDAVLYRVIDVRVIDSFGVNGTASAVRGVAERGLKYLQTGFVQSYVFVMLLGAILIVGYLLGGL